VPEIPEVGPEALDDPPFADAVLLDVRQPGEWVAGHAPGARHVPMDDVPASLATLPRDRRIVAVCRSGGRSGRVAAYLVAEGFDAWNLVGGMQAWAACGRPVVTDAGGPGAVA
jgi:rhodanese-related sulfurtransferase